jgi:pyridoxamine 5'-phosphate oxidase
MSDRGADPIDRFAAWYEEARRAGLDADVVALATASLDARPSVRMVLFRGLDRGGLRFFTSYESRKGRELDENPRAALCFHWALLGRQVRIEGSVERLPAADSDEYFRSRPRASQLSALASPQSRPIASRDELIARRRAFEEQLLGREVPRPSSWGGYRLIPDRVELWLADEHRLHHRWLFTQVGGDWREELLGP